MTLVAANTTNGRFSSRKTEVNLLLRLLVASALLLALVSPNHSPLSTHDARWSHPLPPSPSPSRERSHAGIMPRRHAISL